MPEITKHTLSEELHICLVSPHQKYFTNSSGDDQHAFDKCKKDIYFVYSLVSSSFHLNL